ncbi:hypothetical protein [Streptomyces sp. NPDC059003]
MPDGLEMTFEDACTRLGVAPREDGYALWALAGRHQDTGQPSSNCW